VKFLAQLLPVSGCLALAGCTTLADHWSADPTTPAAPGEFRHGRTTGAAPSPRRWWTVFRDPYLNELVAELEASNPDAGAALARVDQAYAVLGLTGAERFPRVAGEASAIRDQESLSALNFPIAEPQVERYRVAANAQWELDLWGRIRAAYQRDKRKAFASEEEFRAVLLSLQASLVRQYFALRFAQRELAILQRAVSVRAEALQLQETRVEEGAGIELDAARARTELESTRARAEAVRRTIGTLEHALAELTARAPSQLRPATTTSSVRLPPVPAGVPSDLLARRPDLRAAEENLLAASQQVGLRRVEFLPRIRLTGTGGVASLQTQTLFTTSDSLFYSLGPQVDIPLFQAGARQAAVDQARAQWREALETYRSTLLTAVREVDDSLLNLQISNRQLVAQRKAVAAARETVRLSRLRYDRGLVSYLEVVDAQRSRLESEQAENALLGEQAAATVQLIQALGGGWGPVPSPSPPDAIAESAPADASEGS